MDLNFALDEIQQAAEKILKAAAGKKVFALHGEMGAGKTTLVHALCNVLGVKDLVNSPTYSIINEYTAANNQPVYHLDLYRLSNEQEAFYAGVEDCLYSGNYCFAEWPEKAPGIFPPGTIQLTLTATGDNTRKLEFKL
ncbi:MAG TPA: tRNA (adenosine(37)-N6)-threonylcarbamoyltransferase complex ATPase subunit type 1 TsaE [Ferruginibacter sp.]|nr:tRNA (adenosine(37)-N6)-threonylcarbamoyltransferase complex ATPase subunit type 1 TsaE [Ferruginibacter sp.]HMP20817.1 tRNA (adenosine(37)-N6)-threonylcarbamoyltransferase complex ATPase subunit type 1 TsaE [Ferruginibacter sp.]